MKIEIINIGSNSHEESGELQWKDGMILAIISNRFDGCGCRRKGRMVAKKTGADEKVEMPLGVEIEGV
ncbi:hypothetical protein [Hydrogenispora ethanolica]|uniref:hypothetical protein n=1 Tax=Hydrogenispora ethanolica TaxID=1082276 RepID=UPI0010481B27|nr:hypothetical protein [Hydrogenispora ethanolica]